MALPKGDGYGGVETNQNGPLMKTIALSLTLAVVGQTALAEGCPAQAMTYSGVWLDGTTPSAPYRLTLPSTEAGAVGCYWIAATPAWGINEEVTLQARVENPDLEGGVLIAVDQSWIWVPKDGMSANGFKEMWFNRQTKGIPR